MSNVRIAFRCLEAIVGPKQDGVEHAGGKHDHGAYNHSVVAVPRILRRTWPHHINDGQDTISERRQVYRPRPDAQTKRPAWLPALRSRDQGSQNNHLEGDVDS